MAGGDRGALRELHDRHTVWRCGTARLSRFAADVGAMDDATASSIEAHLVACATCRRQLSSFADPSVVARHPVTGDRPLHVGEGGCHHRVQVVGRLHPLAATGDGDDLGDGEGRRPRITPASWRERTAAVPVAWTRPSGGPMSQPVARTAGS